MWSRDWLAAADREFGRASGNDAVTCGVDDGEFTRSEYEGDELKAARSKMNPPETDERTQGSTVDVGMRDVELDNLVAGDRAGVFDTY